MADSVFSRARVPALIAVLCLSVGAAAWIGVRDLSRQVKSEPGLNPAVCGHWCVMHVCRMLGKSVSLEDVMRDMPATDGSHSMLELKDALQRYGIVSDGLRVERDQLDHENYASSPEFVGVVWFGEFCKVVV